VGVDRICEIKGCGSFFDALLLSFRGEDEYVCLDKVVVDQVEKVECVDIRIDKDFLDLRDPFVHLALVAGEAVLLVCPVSGDTFLCDFVHPARTDLHLYPYTCLAHQCAVQGLVAVVLRIVHPVADAV